MTALLTLPDSRETRGGVRENGVFYLNRDGNPISDHTLQFDWIALIKGNLDALYAHDADVFVAGDLLWYPVEGDNRTRFAPDVLVAFGRPKGPRGSYRQWREGGIAPQVVFEVLSPGNRAGEMANKLAFYEEYGVEEYYLYDPFRFRFAAWRRDPATGRLVPQQVADGYVSPRLGIRFVPHLDAPLEVFLPDGRPFLSFEDLGRRISEENRWADAAKQRIAAMEARLRALGVEPDDL